MMKLVTVALEWSHQAGETDVKPETLRAAAELHLKATFVIPPEPVKIDDQVW
ncbi:MAG: hypothetical protein NVS4B7_19090 [Ktedonobacteraceae bacterium]